jgi:hypothetical protein
MADDVRAYPLSRPPGHGDYVLDRGRQLHGLLGGSEVSFVLIDGALCVGPEMIRVCPEETLGVRRSREAVESVFLERLQLLGPNPPLALDLGQLQLLTLTRLAKAAADLEHCDSLFGGSHSVAPTGPTRQLPWNAGGPGRAPPFGQNVGWMVDRIGGTGRRGHTLRSEARTSLHRRHRRRPEQPACGRSASAIASS